MFLNHFSVEDFSKPIENEFIQTRPDTNILNYLCQDLIPKLEITKHIVNCIKKRNKLSFPTHSHLKWAMECVGFAFSLPIEHSPIIFSAIEIYRNWLDLTSEDRPDCLVQEESFYQQEMISHASLLFLERGGDLHKHAELCKEVLFILLSLCRNSNLKTETWEHLLSMFLLISSEVLKKHSSLSQEITPLLFKVLFEAWVRSDTRKTHLWDQLNHNFQYVLKNPWLIYHWASVQLALTKSVIDLIHGTEKKRVKIIFKSLPKPFEQDVEIVMIDTKQEQNIYFWYQFWMIMQKNTLAVFPKKSEICVELVKAVASLTEEILFFARSRNSGSKIEFECIVQEHENLNSLLRVFYDIHNKFVDKVNRVPIPRVNTILDIFGNWMFEYSNNEVDHCIKARGKAIGAICRIFSSDLGPVNRRYACKLYQMIFKIIKSDTSPIVIKKFLKHSSRLFSCNIQGIRLLCDKDMMLKFLLAHISDKKNDANIRKYCYSILSSFCMSNNSETKLDCVKVIQEILLEGIMNEQDPVNFNKIVWITCSFFLIVNSNTDILQSLLLALVNRLKNITDDRMYNDLTSVISTVPFLVRQSSVSFNNFANKIVYKICGYVRKRLHCHTDILNNLLFSLLKWIRSFPFTLNDLDLRTELLDVLACTKLSDVAGELSEYLEDFILCSLGKNSVTLEILGSAGVEIPSGLFQKPTGKWHHYLLYKSVLISISGNEDEIILILRNRIGRSIYKIQPKYRLPDSSISLNFSIETYSFTPSYYQPTDIEFDFELSPNEANLQKSLNDLISSQNATQYKGSFLSIEAISTLQTSNNFPLNPQLILSQLGFIDTDQIEHILESEPDSVAQIITDLDRFGSKETYFLPILFLSTSSSLDFLSTLDSFSSNFWDFLNQLGAKLGPQHTDLGFLSHISMHLDRYHTILYSSDSSHEIISIVPCISGEEMSLKEVVGSSPAVIIWNSQQDDLFCNFQPSVLKYPELEHKDCVILTPLKENLVRVNFHPNKGIPGPLLDNMVVPLPIVGKMVIYTVVNIYGNSHDAVQTTKNRKFLLEQLEMLEKGKEGLERIKLDFVGCS